MRSYSVFPLQFCLFRFVFLKNRESFRWSLPAFKKKLNRNGTKISAAIRAGELCFYKTIPQIFPFLKKNYSSI